MNDPAMLAARLDAGWILVDQEPDPAKRARLEDHWIGLLHQYVAAVDRQRQMEPPWMTRTLMEAAA
jgi:hypothetical protein